MHSIWKWPAAALRQLCDAIRGARRLVARIRRHGARS